MFISIDFHLLLIQMLHNLFYIYNIKIRAGLGFFSNHLTDNIPLPSPSKITKHGFSTYSVIISGLIATKMHNGS